MVVQFTLPIYLKKLCIIEEKKIKFFWRNLWNQKIR